MSLVTKDGLDGPEAVPFLIGVLKNGPDWTGETLLKARGGMYPHIARCYAALSLGVIGDHRGFDPLTEVLEHGDFLEDKYAITHYQKDKYHISEYAALALGYLADPNALEPLIDALQNHEREWAIYGLTMLRDVRAIKPIIQYASSHAKLDYRVHSCLEFISRARIWIRYSTAVRTYTLPDFPELGELQPDKVYKVLWEHWLREGDRFARQEFEKYYDIWKRLSTERPDNRISEDYVMSSMLRGGAAVLPYVLEEIEKGDETLIPGVSYLTRLRSIRPGVEEKPELRKDATREECLQWWTDNKDRWVVFQAEK
jgi:hypothetical protein